MKIKFNNKVLTFLQELNILQIISMMIII